MLKEIVHIGVTVTDLERSIDFYHDVLGLKLTGRLEMEGEDTDKLFNRKNTRVRIAYLNGAEYVACPPVELIEYVGEEPVIDSPDLRKTSISEICFNVKDCDALYQRLVDHGVECLSEPITFDFRDYGFMRSKVFYFKDPDGIILEAIQNLE